MDPTRFLDFFATQHGRTKRVLETLPSDRLDYQPAPSLRTVRALVEHIINIYQFLGKMLVTGDYGLDKQPESEAPKTTEEAVERLEGVYDDVVAKVEAMPAERWAATLRPFGYPLAAEEAAREVVEHVIHHRGQLHVYAVLLGENPPYLFAPLDAPLSRH